MVLDYGAIISIPKSPDVPEVFAWLRDNLGAKLPKGVAQLSLKGGFIFFGDSGKPPVKVTVGKKSPEVCHVAFRALDKKFYNLLCTFLCTPNGGFKMIKSDADSKREFAVFTHVRLGFSFHLSWRENPPCHPDISTEE